MLRRFVPPLVLLGIAVLVLLARLWDIQMAVSYTHLTLPTIYSV